MTIETIIFEVVMRLTLYERLVATMSFVAELVVYIVYFLCPCIILRKELYIVQTNFQSEKSEVCRESHWDD